MLIDPADLDGPARYRLMISVVVPRPIAWVSTLAGDGTPNAAPFSYFQALSSSPPTVMISVGKRREGTPKDTRANIVATGEFVVNVVGEASGARMVRTSRAYEPGESEFEQVGLEPAPSTKVKTPRIAESAVSMECKLDRVIEIGASAICIGEIVCFHVRDDVLAQDGATVDPWKLRPLGRLGGKTYAPLREVLEITPDDPPRTVDSEMVELWVELRTNTIRFARSVPDELLTRAIQGGGDTVGRVLRHIGACTRYYRLRLADREDEDEHHPWDPSFTGRRIAAELEEDMPRFLAAIREATPLARDLLRRAIRHEAWHMGQIAAVLRNDVDPGEVWGMGAL